MKLLIVESPNKKQTISKYLGPGWRVEASMGHVCDLPLKTLGILLPAYKPLYELTDRGKKTIDRLKAAAKDADSIWLAMDPDREGEAIAGNIARYLKTVVSTFYRVVFNEITQKSIQAAVANPRKLNRPLYEAQQARRVIDRLVGYQVSPRLSRVTNQKLSAGRVQSVALRLLVERERAIRAFAPTEHCGVRLNFNTEGIEWGAHWQTEPFVDEDNPYVLDKALAEQVAQIKEVVVLSASKKAATRKAPPPFITTTLQRAASIHLNINAEEAMRVAQHLFEKGLITYHRTDSPNLSGEAIAPIHEELNKLGLREHIAKPANRWKAKAGAQEAHEAIRPTNPALLNTLLDIKAQNLYELIRIRALACQLSAAKVELSTIVLAPVDEKQSINGVTPQFIAKGAHMLYPGWRLLISNDQAEEKLDDKSQMALPDLQEKQILISIKSEVLALKTQAPKRYSEPALIAKLEKEGIGRPSTYAAILSTLQNRGYIQFRGKLFEITPTAETIYDALVGKFQFMEIEYTRAMESALDQIAEGKQEHLAVVAAADQELQRGLRNLH
ncbi:MAG TPA: type I DNA topoisomerase [Gammaproteobacteria bacterium]|nr:type I DNA topoisomerase [Gammaproteobacteria bacterium]